MGTVPISVIMGFDYPLDASQVQLLLSVHQVIFLKNSIYVVNLDNKLLQQISTIFFLTTVTSSVSQRVTTWGWIGIESSPQPVFDIPYDPFFVVVIRIWDWSRWRAGEKVFPTEITLTTTQPDITQVHMFHSRHLNLGKPNAKTGALQMLTLGSFCPLTDQQRVCSRTTWMFVQSSQCKNGLFQTKPDCKEINWSSFVHFSEIMFRILRSDYLSKIWCFNIPNKLPRWIMWRHKDLNIYPSVQ